MSLSYLAVATFRLTFAEANIDGVRAHKILYRPSTNNNSIAISYDSAIQHAIDTIEVFAD